MKSNYRNTCCQFLLTIALVSPLQLAAQGTFSKASNADCLVWNQQPEPNENIVIMGICEQGYLNGPAVVQTYKENQLYQTAQSYYINGKSNGDTRLLSNDFNFTGQMRDGLFNGYGEIQSKDITYKGEFLNHKLHGYGEAFYRSGIRYSGYYWEGKPQGFGEMRYPNGGRYVGNWHAGKYHGEGILYKPTGEFAGIGIFENGKFVRLSDVYDKISNQKSSPLTSVIPRISPPTFIEGEGNRQIVSPAFNQPKSVNVTMPNGSVVPGVMWSTQKQGTINGGVFLQILR
jgi:hypothetical protein